MLNIPAGRDLCLLEVEWRCRWSDHREQSRDCTEAQEGRAMVSWADREGYAYPRSALPRLICEGSGEEGSPEPDLHR